MLREVREESGGVFLSATRIDDLAAPLERSRFAILHPYEIRDCPVEAALAAPLRLQVYSPHGYAEEVLLTAPVSR